MVAFFVCAALVLIPWTVLLIFSPQQVDVGKHWHLVWGGFDCFLLLGFVQTAARIARRSPSGAITAAATGAMLLVDAWFDIWTARSQMDTLTAVVMAVLAEVPCALICFFAARRIIRQLERAALASVDCKTGAAASAVGLE